MDKEKKLVGGWWMWVLLLMIVSGIVLTGLSYVGLIGRTVVERKVFENSFQYSEARKAEVAAYQATLAEIERKLATAKIDEGTRANLEAQASGIRIQLNVARAK